MLDYIICGIGVAAVAFGTYYLFKKLMKWVTVILILIGTVVAVETVNQGESAIAVIFIVGIMVGLISIPFQLVEDIEDFQKRIMSLEKNIKPDSENSKEENATKQN